MKRLGPLLLAGTWLVFFSRLLSGRFVYFFDDLKIIYFPLEVIYANFQAAGQLPVWSNLFGFGQPLLAWGQLGFFTPLHVLLRAVGVPPLDLLQVSVALYFAIGLAGLYAFLRRLGFPDLSAALGAIVYTFSGFNIGHLNHVNFYTATMVLPWLLVALHWLIKQPSWRKCVLVALVAAVMALSAQPQVVLYCFVIAAIIGSSFLLKSRKDLRAKLSWLALATLLFLLLSSFATLPLAEFLPLTERSGRLPVEELLDFSYPPSHAITLLLPYFYGDHDSYWGAKGFQELAAFVGLIPLALAGLALTSWRRHHSLRIASSVLMMGGIVVALGEYSPLYRYLVEEHILTNLAIPGRFVFLFDTGIALLAALGLSELTTLYRRPTWSRWPVIGLSFIPVLVLALPFGYRLAQSETLQRRLWQLVASNDPTWLILLAGLVLLLVTYTATRPKFQHLAPAGLVGLASFSLLVMAWNYNPLTKRSLAQESPLAQELRASGEHIGLPARLYSRDTLLVDAPSIANEEIEPRLSIWQPVVAAAANPCFTVSFTASDAATGAVAVGLHQELTEPPLSQLVVTSQDVNRQADQQLCFTAPAGKYTLSFTSGEASGLALSLRRLPDDKRSAYLVRLTAPSGEQLAASQKALEIVLRNSTDPIDDESVILARHLNVVANASSGRWIGALSLKPYREFIEVFFANDWEDQLYDGDGRHILERHRTFFDLAGVTHFAQHVPAEATDLMPEHNLTPAAQVRNTGGDFRLYTNPQAYPKAWLVNNYQFIAPADETRTAMMAEDFDPHQILYLSGPGAPEPLASTGNGLAEGTVTITRYEETMVEAWVETPTPTWLVITDNSTPQWRTFIDDQLAQHYIAYSTFKAAQVPAGQHTVRFEYLSPAIDKAKRYTISGLILSGILLIFPTKKEKAS